MITPPTAPRPRSQSPWRPLTRLLPVLAVVGVCVAMTVRADEGTVLLQNGDFDEGSQESAWPEGWNRGDTGTSWEAEGDERFIRFQASSPDRMISLFREIPLPEGTRGLDVTVRYRTRKIVPGEKPWFDARMILHFLDADRKELAPDPSPIALGNDTKEWKTVRREILVPPNAASLQLMPCLFRVKSGTLELAEIRITAMPPERADAIAAEKAAAKARDAERAALIQADLARPSVTQELKVTGNQVTTLDGRPVWLQGLSVDSMQWSQGENILWSIRVALDDWNANVIRLPVHDTFWFGKGKGQPAGGEKAYRETVDQAIKLAATRGAWIVLDLHRFGAPTEECITFWKDAAVRYRNNPAVLFELFNEAHGITWEIWRNGGSLRDVQHGDVNPVENTLKVEADHTPGMQALVRTVRDTGAKNIIVAGGLDWAYDLWGVVNGFALDDLGGNGIIYVSHIYPWKRDWRDKVLVAADTFPIIITEIGCPRRWEDFSFIPPEQRYPLEGWSEDVLGMIQKYKLHWTGFSFHPVCGPPVIQDWNYTPTPFWGVYVKDALKGKPFEMKKMR